MFYSYVPFPAFLFASRSIPKVVVYSHIIPVRAETLYPDLYYTSDTL